MSFNFHALCDLGFAEFDDALEDVNQYAADILALFHQSEIGEKYAEIYKDDGSWVEPFLTYAFSYNLPPLPHMTAGDVRALLTDIFPGKVSANQDQAQTIIPEMIAFWQFIASEFDHEDPEPILKYLEKLEKAYPEIIMDETKFGFAKNLVSQMTEEGIDILDQTSVDAFIEHYNQNLLQDDEPFFEELPTKTLKEKQNEYPSPVVDLLTLGEPKTWSDWPDYLKSGFRLEHVPDLNRMAVDWELHWDTSEDELYWAPIHAWRVLGQLQAEEAAESLISLLGFLDEFDSDWIGEEVPEVFGMIGPSTIPHLNKFLNEGGEKLWGRVAAAYGLEIIGKKYYSARVECINVLTEQLKAFYENQDILNGSLISSLIELKGTEALPVIEEAYRSDMVDLMTCGDWEDVQIEFGMLSKRITPPSYGPFSDWDIFPQQQTTKKPDTPVEDKKAKAKSKQQKKSKKQNRGKKKKRRRK